MQVSMRTSQRENTAALIRSMMGGDVVHGVAMLGATSTDQNGRVVTTGILKMIGEAPLTDGTCDMVECDVYIVPRSRTVGISEPPESFDKLDVDMCRAVAKLAKGR